MATIDRHRFSREIIDSVRSLYTLDNFHGVVAVVQNLAIVAATVVLAEQVGWAAYLPALILIGSRQRALATLTHEAAHGTLARNKTLNDMLGTVFSGYAVAMLLRSYKGSHVRDHHGSFGDPETDCDFRYMIEQGVYGRSKGWTYIWHVIVSPALLLKVPAYLAYLVRDRFFVGDQKNDRREVALFAAFWFAIVASSLAFGGFDLLFWYWLVPFFSTYQVIGWYIELAEHAPLMQRGKDIYMSRNRNSHWAEAVLTGMHGESFHLAHHLFPRVPFWRMRELNQILRQDAVYRACDDECGGIFLSSNDAPSLVAQLVRDNIGMFTAGAASDPIGKSG
ncbi:MAG: fatty acid desaturase family protein [Pseudomonadota bacterium]